MAKVVVNTKKAPGAIGPYEQGIRFDKLIFTSGQIPIDPVTGMLVKGDIKAQTRQALDNIKEILNAGGSSIGNVIKTTVYLKDLSDFDMVNEAYNEIFKDSRPARSCVEVSALPKGADIEIEAIGYISFREE